YVVVESNDSSDSAGGSPAEVNCPFRRFCAVVAPASLLHGRAEQRVDDRSTKAADECGEDDAMSSETGQHGAERNPCRPGKGAQESGTSHPTGGTWTDDRSISDQSWF